MSQQETEACVYAPASFRLPARHPQALPSIQRAIKPSPTRGLSQRIAYGPEMRRVLAGGSDPMRSASRSHNIEIKQREAQIGPYGLGRMVQKTVAFGTIPVFKGRVVNPGPLKAKFLHDF